MNNSDHKLKVNDFDELFEEYEKKKEVSNHTDTSLIEIIQLHEKYIEETSFKVDPEE